MSAVDDLIDTFDDRIKVAVFTDGNGNIVRATHKHIPIEVEADTRLAAMQALMLELERVALKKKKRAKHKTRYVPGPSGPPGPMGMSGPPGPPSHELAELLGSVGSILEGLKEMLPMIRTVMDDNRTLLKILERRSGDDS